MKGLQDQKQIRLDVGGVYLYSIMTELQSFDIHDILYHLNKHAHVGTSINARSYVLRQA